VEAARAWAPAMPERVAAAPGAPGAVMAARAWSSVLHALPVNVTTRFWVAVLNSLVIAGVPDTAASPLDQSETTTTNRPPAGTPDAFVVYAPNPVELVIPLVPGR